MTKVIQWFPGHMAKTIRQVKEQLKLVDVVVECLDARVPMSSRNPLIDQLAAHKKRVIVLNKVDLADRLQTNLWKEYFESLGYTTVLLNAKMGQGLDQLQMALRKLMASELDRLKEKGVVERTIRLLILGIPNAGKSTLINRMVGKNQAETGNRPGVTKALRWLKYGKDFELLDTPGILWPKFEDQSIGYRLAITGAIKDQLLYMDDIALFALKEIGPSLKNALEERYGIELPTDILALPQYLMDVTQKMGYKDDYERASERLITELRQGRLGAFTLDDFYRTEGVN